MYYLSRFRLRASTFVPVRNTFRRSFSVSDNPTDEEIPDSEKKIISVLQNRFTDAKTIRVNDVSGGCGAMFDITVISPEFKDMSIVKQHKMVTEALKQEIKQMHGLRISTDHEIEHKE